MLVNRSELKNIIQEEYKVLLKEKKLNLLKEEYNKFSKKQQLECKILGLQFVTDLYESNLINNKQIQFLLSEAGEQSPQESPEQNQEQPGFFRKLANKASNAYMNYVPAGIILKKLGMVGENDPLGLLKGVLDIIGFIPGFGEVADAINVGISALEKDPIGVALNAVSMIPDLGDIIAKPIKYLLNAKKAIPLKYLQKIIPALEKFGPVILNKLRNFSGKIPIGKQKAATIVKAVENGIQFALKFFKGSADEVAKNVGDFAAKRIKAANRKRNRQDVVAGEEPQLQPA
jgi:hypothetical protein